MGKAIGNFVGNITGANQAADAAREGSGASAAVQREGLEYMKESERLPMGFRDAAFGGLAPEYGLAFDEYGNPISDGSTIHDRVLSSDRYQHGREAGREGIANAAAATGGLRSGNAQDAFYRADQAAYDNAYANQISGLTGFAGAQSLAPQIAQQYSNIGTTLGQGVTAAGQAQQAGRGMLFSGLLGLGKSAIGLI